MTRQIVLEGSNEEIAEQIINLPENVVRATVVLDLDSGNARPPGSGPVQNHAWLQELRQWAASHKSPASWISDDRESIYADRLR